MMRPSRRKCEGNFAMGATTPLGSFLAAESSAGSTDAITKDPWCSSKGERSLEEGLSSRPLRRNTVYPTESLKDESGIGEHFGKR